MTSQELGAAVYAANDIALQWYLATHATAPAADRVVIQPVAGGGLAASFGSGTMLLVGVAIIAAVVLLKK